MRGISVAPKNNSAPLCITMATVRKATVEDAVAVARVHVLSWQETYAGIVPQSYLDALNIDTRAKYWATHLQNPDAFDIYVGEVDGEICGIAAGDRAREPEHGYEGEILLIYVLKAAKGKGLGRMLMREVRAFLEKKEIQRVMLWVLKDNPSRGFYEHLGGKQFKQKNVPIAGTELVEVAYGWEDMTSF